MKCRYLPLLLLMLAFSAISVSAQSNLFIELQQGYLQKSRGFVGEMNAFYSTRSLGLNLGYERQFKNPFIQGAGISVGYRNVIVLLRSERLPFYDNSFLKQSVRLGYDGVELGSFVKRTVNEHLTIRCGVSALWYFPSLAAFETHIQTNPNYRDTSLYQFTEYQVTSGSNYNKSKSYFSPGFSFGMDCNLSKRLKLQLSYKWYSRQITDVSEFGTMEARTKNGWTESMGYFQSYSLPLHYIQAGLLYRLNWFHRWLN